MHETGCSGLVHSNDREGWEGEGGGRGVQDGEHMYTLFPYTTLFRSGVFLSGLLHSIIGSSFIHLIRTDSNVFFLMAE